MLVALITIGYNLPGSTARLLESARAGCRHDLIFLLFSHSRIPEKNRELELLAQVPSVVYHDYGVNRGLARSWNEGLLWANSQSADAILIVNEDIVFGDGDVGRLVETASRRRDCPIVTGRAFHHSEKAWSSSEYGCFVLNPIALQTVGCFDENFFPIYCEDSDYRRRLLLAELVPAFCESTRIVHGGSRSLADEAVARQNGVTYARNRLYYRRKWGGEGGTEQFDHPFNDARFTHYIDPRVRNAPYPGFNRTDQHIVQV